MLNLALLLEQSARRNPGKLAVILDDYKLRYAEVNGAANKLANALVKMGVQRGDKVAVMLPNTPHFPICYYGILKAGATVVPLNVLLKHNEVQYHLEDSDSVALIAFEGFLAEAAPGFRSAEGCRNLVVVQAPGSANPIPDGATNFNQIMAEHSPAFDTVQTGPGETAVILYTSGTTGRPKGAELSHFNLFYNAVVRVHEAAARQRRTTVGPGGAAALPLLRPDLHAERACSAPAARSCCCRASSRDEAFELHPARQGDATSPACRRCTSRC